MNFYEDPKGIKEYVAMCKDYDPKELCERLRFYLPVDSKILELGSGPGNDLEYLSKNYNCTASDNSRAFINHLRQRFKDKQVLFLDAVGLDHSARYNCIFSNKVLHHLTKEELVQSVNNQLKLLSERGIVFHTFWKGEKTEEHHSLRFVHYTENDLRRLFRKCYDILELKSYKELKADDSIVIIARKNNWDNG